MTSNISKVTFFKHASKLYNRYAVKKMTFITLRILSENDKNFFIEKSHFLFLGGLDGW